jgi:hypothetical protein
MRLVAASAERVIRLYDRSEPPPRDRLVADIPIAAVGFRLIVGPACHHAPRTTSDLLAPFQ